MIGIWDDHDYGEHDGDRHNPVKHMMRKLYLDFIGEPMTSQRRTEADRGLYASYYADASRIVKILLIDIHFEREGQDDLGRRQEEWLERQVMDEADSKIFVIVSPSPLIACDRPGGDKVRNLSRKYILELIRRKNKKFFIISGELHYAEFTQLNYLTRRGDQSDLYEVMSSGLTHINGLAETVPFALLQSFNVPSF